MWKGSAWTVDQINGLYINSLIMNHHRVVVTSNYQKN